MNKPPHKYFINELALNQKFLIEFVLIVVVLGIGLDLCILSMFSILAYKDQYIISIFGTMLCFLGVSFILYKLLGSRKISKTIKAFIIINRNTNEIISIENYDFAHKLALFLNAAIIEDETMKMNLAKANFIYDGDQESVKLGRKIVNDLTNYYIINSLSVHLADFYNISGIDKKKLVRITRDDLPAYLLDNQFLDLFSKPMNQRQVFKNNSMTESDSIDGKREVVVRKTKGAIFQLFDFVLPIKGELLNDGDYIKISTDKMVFKFRSRYENFGTNLPIGYLKYYLNIDRSMPYSVHQVLVDIEVKINIYTLIISNGLKYYKWIDSFMDKIEKRIDIEKYFDKIGWDNAYVILKKISKE